MASAGRGNSISLIFAHVLQPFITCQLLLPSQHFQDQVQRRNQWDIDAEARERRSARGPPTTTVLVTEKMGKPSKNYYAVSTVFGFEDRLACTFRRNEHFKALIALFKAAADAVATSLASLDKESAKEITAPWARIQEAFAAKTAAASKASKSYAKLLDRQAAFADLLNTYNRAFEVFYAAEALANVPAKQQAVAAISPVINVLNAFYAPSFKAFGFGDDFEKLIGARIVGNVVGDERLKFDPLYGKKEGLKDDEITDELLANMCFVAPGEVRSTKAKDRMQAIATARARAKLANNF